MRARSLLTRIALALCAATSVLALASVPASAKLTHPLLGTFGSFGNIQAIAVDNSTGDVYVYDSETHEILKFDGEGNPEEFVATGTDAITGVPAGGDAEEQLAVDNSSGPNAGDIYVADSKAVLIYSSAGIKVGELTEESNVPWGVYVCGVAVDGGGNVYVGIYEGYVNKYVPSGGTVTNSDYTASLKGVSEPCNVAVDSAGYVFTNAWGDGVTRYSPLEFSAIGSATGEQVDARGRTLAIDPATDELYVDDQVSQDIEQFGPHGEPMEKPVLTLGKNLIQYSYGIAVSGASGYAGDVYVSSGEAKTIRRFGPVAVLPTVTTGAVKEVETEGATLTGTIAPEGATIEECFFEYGESTSYTGRVPCVETPAQIGTGARPVVVHAAVNGLAEGTYYHFRLVGKTVAGESTGEDAEFRTAAPPAVRGEQAQRVGTDNATVRAEVSPEGGVSTYRFEYGTSTAYGHSVPVPNGNVGNDLSYHVVLGAFTGLEPGTTYHFRVVASNAAGTTEGPDETLSTFASASPEGGSCPNAAIRSAQKSTYLPECRAYEMVSPVQKNGGNVAADGTLTQTAVSGDAIKYTSTAAFGDVPGSEVRGAEYLSRRGADGWVTHGINPAQSVPVFGLGKTSEYQYLTPELTEGVYYALSPVLAGHPNVEGAANLYLRTDVLAAPPGSYELLSDSIGPVPDRPAGSAEAEVNFAAASKDMSRILFESYDDLTEAAEGLSTHQPKLYEWHQGVVTLAGVLPDGKPAQGSIAGAGAGIGEGEGGWTLDTMSEDGSRVIFQAAPFANEYARTGAVDAQAGNLYMRIDGKQTIQLNVSERTDCNVERKEREPAYKCTGMSEPDPNGPQPAVFRAATADDSKVFFTTRAALTDDAQGSGEYGETAENLYMYQLNAPEGERLTLISKDENPEGDRYGNSCGCGWDRAIGVNGISADGSYVYFTSRRALLPGDPEGTNGEEFEGNLYVWHDGQIRFIVTRRETTQSGLGTEGWGEKPRSENDVFRVTPDGETIAFVSADPTTAERLGYTSTPRNTFGDYVQQAYVYTYGNQKLVCVSCNRNGLPLTSRAGFAAGAELDGADIYHLSEENNTTMYLDRALSENGRYVFFDTAEALVARDTNGRRDVYEYDTTTGKVHLLSSGTCACDASFVDASPDGSNVFIVTHEKLVAADSGADGDLYDVRVNGGIAAQNAVPTAPCTGEECQPPAAGALSFPLSASSGFEGPVNPAVMSPHRGKGGKLTSRQELRRAVRGCRHRHPHRGRRPCLRRARARYGAGGSRAQKHHGHVRRGARNRRGL